MPGQQGNLNGSTIMYDEQISRYVSETQKDTNHKMTFPFSREAKKDLLEQAINKHPVYRNLAITLDSGGESTISSGLLKDIIIEQYLLVDQDLPNPAISDAQRIPYIDIAVLNKIVMIVKETDIDAAMNGLVTNDLGIKREIASAVQQGEMYGMSLEKVLEQDKESAYKVFESFKPLEEDGSFKNYLNDINLKEYKNYLDFFDNSNDSKNTVANNWISKHLYEYIQESNEKNSTGFLDQNKDEGIGKVTFNGQETNAIMLNKTDTDIYRHLILMAKADKEGDREKCEKILRDMQEKYKDNKDAKRFFNLMAPDGNFTVENALAFRIEYNKAYNKTKIIDDIDEDIKENKHNVDFDKIKDDKERERTLKRFAVGLVSYEPEVQECFKRRLKDYTIQGMRGDEFVEKFGMEKLEEYVIGELETYKGKPIKKDNGYAELFREEKFLSNNDLTRDTNIIKSYEKRMEIAGEFSYPEDATFEERRKFDKAYKESSSELGIEYERIADQGLGVDKQQYEIGKYIESFDLANNSAQGAVEVKRLLLELYNREFVRVFKREPTEEDYGKKIEFSCRSEFEKTKKYLMNNHPEILEDIMKPSKEDKRKVFTRTNTRDLVFKEDAPQRIMDDYKANGHKRVGSMVHFIEYASEKGYREQIKLEESIHDYQSRIAAFMKYEGKPFPKGYEKDVSQEEVTSENYEQKKEELVKLLDKMPPEFFVDVRSVAFGTDVKLKDLPKVYIDLVKPRKKDADEAIKKRLQDKVKITEDGKVENNIEKYKQPVNMVRFSASMIQRAITMRRVKKERSYERVDSTDLMKVNDSFGARFSSWFSGIWKSELEKVKQDDDVKIYRANKQAEIRQAQQEKMPEETAKDNSSQIEQPKKEVEQSKPEQSQVIEEPKQGQPNIVQGQPKQMNNPWELEQNLKRETQEIQRQIGKEALEHQEAIAQHAEVNQENRNSVEQSSDEQEM